MHMQTYGPCQCAHVLASGLIHFPPDSSAEENAIVSFYLSEYPKLVILLKNHKNYRILFSVDPKSNYSQCSGCISCRQMAKIMGYSLGSDDVSFIGQHSTNGSRVFLSCLPGSFVQRLEHFFNFFSHPGKSMLAFPRLFCDPTQSHPKTPPRRPQDPPRPVQDSPRPPQEVPQMP